MTRCSDEPISLAPEDQIKWFSELRRETAQVLENTGSTWSIVKSQYTVGLTVPAVENGTSLSRLGVLKGRKGEKNHFSCSFLPKEACWRKKPICSTLFPIHLSIQTLPGRRYIFSGTTYTRTSYKHARICGVFFHCSFFRYYTSNITKCSTFPCSNWECHLWRLL